MYKKTFTLYDIFVTVLSFFSYILDVVTGKDIVALMHQNAFYMFYSKITMLFFMFLIYFLRYGYNYFVVFKVLNWDLKS